MTTISIDREAAYLSDERDRRIRDIELRALRDRIMRIEDVGGWMRWDYDRPTMAIPRKKSDPVASRVGRFIRQSLP